MPDGNLLDSGQYFSDVFNVYTGIWCHFDDYEITQISYMTEGEKVQRRKLCQVQTK